MKRSGILLYIISATGLGMIWLYQFSTPYVEFTDGLSLFNPIYMKLHYNRVVYPAYGYFDNMPVHPPIYYYILSKLIQVGFSFFSTINIPVFAAKLLFVLVVLRAKFSIAIKSGGITAVLLPLISEHISVRPDLFLSLIWITGLTSLEAASRENWKTSKLVLGSTLLAFSSTLHLFGSFAFLGVLPYAFQIFRTRQGEARLAALSAVIFPAVFVIGLYVILYILPNVYELYRQIVFTHTNRYSSLQVHQMVYDWFFADTPFMRTVFYIPATIWAITFFYFILRLRLLIVSAMPVLLFVLFFSPGKSAGYFSPELLLFYWGLTAVLLKSIYFLMYRSEHIMQHRVFRIGAAIAIFIVMVSAIEIGLARSFSYCNFRVQKSEPEFYTARTCAKLIVNEQRGVGSRLDLWYVSGGKNWYNISPDLLWGTNRYDDSIIEYFKNFDAIAEHSHMSNNSQRADRRTISSWYVEDKLHLKGFYLTNNMSNSVFSSNELSMIFYANPRPSHIRGFSNLNNEEILRYEQDSSSPDFYLITALTDRDINWSDKEKTFYLGSSLDLPNKEAGSYQMGDDVEEVLVWALMTQENYVRSIDSIRATMTIKDIIPLNSHKVSQDSLLAGLKSDSVIRFFKTLENFKDNQPYYTESN